MSSCQLTPSWVRMTEVRESQKGLGEHQGAIGRETVVPVELSDLNNEGPRIVLFEQ